MLTKGKMHLVTKNDRLKFCIIFVEDLQVSWLNCHLHKVDLVETWWKPDWNQLTVYYSRVVLEFLVDFLIRLYFFFYFKILQIYEMSSISAYMI